MSTLNLCNVNKIYPNNVQAVFDFNLDIKDKEFIVFVGPSGCGKSTTLRMVAGLEDITAGKLYIDGELMNNVEAAERGIAMVFQSYALYPHMTVFNNMAFCLKMRKFPKPIYDENGNTIPCVDTKLIKKLEKKIRLLTRENKKTHNDDVFQQIEDIKTQIENLKQNPSTIQTRMVHLSKSEINEKVVAAAKVLGLTEYLSRKPGALSGGQRQRVALGRAIVRAPKVFLMDEPLSNLDAKLRVQMRTELTRIHKEVGATTIYVTHDQTEAMTMADRIVVMKDGYIQQIDTPLELFTHPANLFVATFIGSPSMNILEGSLKGDKLALGKEFQLSFGKKSIPNINEFYKNQKEKLTNNIDELNSELNELNENHKKSNAKAIEQRNSILEKDQNSLSACDSYLNGDEIKICFGIRPEHIYLENDSNNKKPSAPISLKIENIELLGSEYIVYSTLNNSTLSFKVSTDKCPKVGDNIKVCFDLSTIHVFDSSSSLRLPL